MNDEGHATLRRGLVNLIPPKTEPMTCKCGNEFGRAYYIDNIFIGAQIGGIIVQTMHGRCANCDRGIHVQVSTKEVMKLFARYGGISPITVEISE